MLLLKSGLLWVIFFPVKYLAWAMPYRTCYWCCRTLSLAGVWFKTGKAAAFLDQLAAMDPDCSETEKKKILRRTFWALLCSEMEMLCFPRMTFATIESLVCYKGLHHLEQALRREKGAMLLFAHFGANQMIMPAMGYKGYSMSQLSAPATVWEEKLPDRRFSKMEKLAMRIRWAHELSLPVGHINIFGSLRGAFMALKRNQILGVALDGGGGAERIPVSFLGRRANFSTGAYEIARRTGCAVLPTFMERDWKTGKNTLIMESPMYIRRECTCMEDKTRFIQLFADRLSEYVRKSPWLYINFMALRRKMVNYDDMPFFVERKRG